MADECVDKEKSTGGVVLGFYSDEQKMGYHAAQGDFSTLVALLAAIINRTAMQAEITPEELLYLINMSLEDDNDRS